jgi:hypothetical protein
MFTKRPLNNKDLLAKYVFKPRELRADGSVRPGNLKPREGEKLSLSEVTELEYEEICTHGHAHVDNPAKGRIHIGYGKLFHESFVRLGLKTIYDNKPPRHVSVEFHDDPEQRRELAKALADEFIIINPESNKKYFSTCPSKDDSKF